MRTRDRAMPGYPTGWFQVAYSQEIPPGNIRSMRYFGQDLVAVRTASEVVSVFEAHCAHRGTHLGRGTVDGERLTCPMHGWEWGPDGSNVQIPGTGETSERCLRSIPTAEVSGLVLLWHDPARNAPDWLPPDVGYHGDPAFYPMYPHGASCAEVRYPPQLALENNVDPQHVRVVHRWPSSPDMDHFHAEGPMFESSFRGVLPTSRSDSDVRILNQAWGVGLLYSWFDGLLRTAQIVAHTPIDRERTHLRHSIWAERQTGDDGDTPTGLAKATIAAQFAEGQSPELGDKKIWENQVYRRRAAFTKEEGPGYAALRRWSRGFYDDAEWQPTLEPTSRLSPRPTNPKELLHG